VLRHVVLMKFVPEATAEQRRAVEDGLADLPAQIPELRSYVIGTDVGASAGNFDFAVVADVDDVDAFRRYIDHPAHMAVVVERIRPIVADRAAVQYEVPDR